VTSEKLIKQMHQIQCPHCGDHEDYCGTDYGTVLSGNSRNFRACCCRHLQHKFFYSRWLQHITVKRYYHSANPHGMYGTITTGIQARTSGVRKPAGTRNVSQNHQNRLCGPLGFLISGCRNPLRRGRGMMLAGHLQLRARLAMRSHICTYSPSWCGHGQRYLLSLLHVSALLPLISILTLIFLYPVILRSFSTKT